MIFILNTQQVKPNRLVPENQKDESYHSDYARWAVGKGSNTKQQARISRYHINKAFYSGNQWIFPEDVSGFFLDESGQDRGRIRVVRNYIQPLVESWRGNVERMSFNFSVYSISPLARKRRDDMLNRLLTYQNVSEQMPEFGNYLRQNGFPMGKDPMETEQMFDNTYTDQYVIGVNRFAKAVSKISEVDKLKGQLSMDVALAGMCVVKPYIHGMDYRFRRVPVENFGYDTSAVDPNLRDAEFFYEVDYMSPTTIFEYTCDLDSVDKERIEEASRHTTHTSYSTKEKYDVGGRIPVFTAYWRDMVSDIYGYVRDNYGQVVLKRINYIEQNEEKPRYTISDTIPVSDMNPYQKKVMKGRRTRTMDADLWRYCQFIPDESISSKYNQKKSKDIVLEYGVAPYQEPDIYRSTNMRPPYIVGTWSYLDGDVLSPVDTAINPQRIINRFTSVMENQLNNSGGVGVVFDKDLAGISEDEVISRIKRNEPVGINAKGRGVQNAVSKYDASNAQSVLAFASLIENFKMGIEQVTGVNEGIKGQTDNPNQLVGVMQLMIQRGSILQEPFYKAVADIYEGVYQNIVTSARRFYIDNDMDLYDFVGEESGTIIKLSKDIRNENMAVAVKRTVDVDQERQYVDQMLGMWIQLGLIDPPTAAKLMGRANIDESLAELKSFNKRMLEQRRLAEQQQAQMSDQAGAQQGEALQAAQGEQVRQESREDAHRNADRMAPIVRENLKQTMGSP